MQFDIAVLGVDSSYNRIRFDFIDFDSLKDAEKRADYIAFDPRTYLRQQGFPIKDDDCLIKISLLFREKAAAVKHGVPYNEIVPSGMHDRPYAYTLNYLEGFPYPHSHELSVDLD